MFQVIANDKTINLDSLIDRAADKYIADHSYFDGNPANPSTAFITFNHSEIAYALSEAVAAMLENLTINDLTQGSLNVPTIATKNGRIIKRDLIAA